MEHVWRLVFGAGLDGVKVEADVFAEGGGGKKWRKSAAGDGHDHRGG